MAPSKTDPPEDVELALQHPLLASHSKDSDEGDLDLADVKENAKKPNYLAGNNAKAISACTLYSCCSVCMVLVNKSLASR
jgi:hypothetical protein